MAPVSNADAKEDGPKGVSDQDDTTGRQERIRNLSAYWLFGLCNNYAYVIMLSSAYDILKSETTPVTQPPPITSHTPNWLTLTNSSKPENPYDCNKASTAIVLLVDIIPSILIKYTSPWFAELVPFDVRILFCVLCTAASFLIVALTHSVPLSLVGVACASAASGLGEYTFLSLAAFYDKNVVSVWSSGTGAAGLFGALSYAGLTAIGLSPRHTILTMLVVPAILAGSYWLLLIRHPNVHNCSWGRRLHDQYTTLPANEPENEREIEDPTEVALRLPVREKLMVIKSLLHLIIPLALVYIAEYFINQGLFELVYFTGIWLSHEDQYRWYQVIYQLGVFISRSSVNLILIRRTWILAVLQLLNVVIFVTHLFYFYIPSIYIVFVIILYEGLLGGAAYVNTFYIIRTDTAADQKEFAMGVTSISDSTGIALAAAIAVPVHQAFCSMSKQ